VNTGRHNFDVFLVANQTTEKPFRNWAAADITGADKEDAFHNSESASERIPNLESNSCKSIYLKSSFNYWRCLRKADRLTSYLDPLPQAGPRAKQSIAIAVRKDPYRINGFFGGFAALIREGVEV